MSERCSSCGIVIARNLPDYGWELDSYGLQGESLLGLTSKLAIVVNGEVATWLMEMKVAPLIIWSLLEVPNDYSPDSDQMRRNDLARLMRKGMDRAAAVQLIVQTYGGWEINHIDFG